MTLENHKKYLCPQSISNKPFDCQGPKCAAFRLYGIDVQRGSDQKPYRIRSFSCGLVLTEDELITEQQLFQNEYAAYQQQKQAEINDDII